MIEKDIEKRIETREQLINLAKAIESETERVKFVLSYFYKNIEYNYAYLFAAFLQGDIEATNPLILNSRIVNNKVEWFFDSKVLGDSELFYELLEEYNRSHDISAVKMIVMRILQEHLDNPDIVEKESSIFINSLLEVMSKKVTVTSEIIRNNNRNYSTNPEWFESLLSYFEENNSIELNRSFSSILCDYIGDEEIHQTMPPVIENGLLKRGVCRDYADYLVELFREIGIEAYRINGKSELAHAWVVAKVDGKWKSIDLVRAVFIRDNYRGIPKNQTAEDWLINDFDRCFMMQQTRCISDIVCNSKIKKFPEDINITNFNYNQFEELLVLLIHGGYHA